MAEHGSPPWRKLNDTIGIAWTRNLFSLEFGRYEHATAFDLESHIANTFIELRMKEDETCKQGACVRSSGKIQCWVSLA
jgi:hypothetical protein